MVDREERDLLVESLRQMLKGNLSVKEYDKKEEYFMVSKDKAVLEIVAEMSWVCDDIALSFWSHKKRVKYHAEFIEHCILFLSTNLEYEWPEMKQNNPFKRLISLLTFYIFPRFREPSQESLNRKYRSSGDVDVWPFLRKEDFEQANCNVKG